MCSSTGSSRRGRDGRPVRDDRTEGAAAADNLAGRAKVADLAAREVVFGYDGETALWRFKLQAWEGGFVKSFQIANDQPTRAHLPPLR